MNGDAFFRPGALLAKRSLACPDCRADIRFVADVNGRPLLLLEHDDSCPMLARIERAETVDRTRVDTDTQVLRGTR